MSLREKQSTKKLSYFLLQKPLKVVSELGPEKESISLCRSFGSSPVGVHPTILKYITQYSYRKTDTGANAITTPQKTHFIVLEIVLLSFSSHPHLLLYYLNFPLSSLLLQPRVPQNQPNTQNLSQWSC